MVLKAVGLGLASVLIAGCSSFSSNMQVGNDQSYLSLKDQREAVRTVKVYDAAPPGSEDIGEVSASRCHRSFVEDAPDDVTVLNDLRVAAFAQGADGIAHVKVSKESALSRNCWYVLSGTARAFMLQGK